MAQQCSRKRKSRAPSLDDIYYGGEESLHVICCPLNIIVGLIPTVNTNNIDSVLKAVGYIWNTIDLRYLMLEYLMVFIKSKPNITIGTALRSVPEIAIKSLNLYKTGTQLTQSIPTIIGIKTNYHGLVVCKHLNEKVMTVK